MLGFVLIELTELYNGGFAYFKDILNWVDIDLICAWYLYCYFNWEYGSKDFMHVKIYTDDVVKMNVLRVFIVIVSFIKIVSYCRVYEGFSGLINML